MFPAIILSLREGLEAALIIGILISVLTRLRQDGLKPVIWRGAGAAALLSILAALVLELIGAEFEGRAEEIFEGVVMLLAAGILTYMVFWMRSRTRGMQTELESGVKSAVLASSSRALFFLAFLAVFREGMELALFLLATRLASNPQQILIGALIGLAGAALLGWLVYTSTRKLDLKRFFQVTNVLLVLFAAGMVGMAIGEFNEAGLIPALVQPLWDLSAYLPQTSLPGQFLRALVGYTAAPSLSAAAAYGVFILVITGLLRRPAAS
ncbi:MAG: iron transporter, partial [Anaerolineaceae bacterium]|nr:iron transporter [Anaerolineaceae bacterium]